MTEYGQKAIGVYDLAVSALRRQDHLREVRKKVEPLTLDELRKMDGEPVSIDCECGMSFSIGSYDYQETYRAWNRRAGENHKRGVQE